MIRVVVADDEPDIRAGVKDLLESADDITVVAEAADGNAAVEAVRRHRPHVALLDIQMPRLDGLAAAEEVGRSHPDTAVLILTTVSDDAFIARALSVGASGFLLKSGGPRELLAGVRAAAEGEAYLSPRVARRVITALGPGERMTREVQARARIAALTDRERDVLALVGAGLSNGAIARRLYLVEGTVKAYLSTAFTRLGVSNRVQAAVLAHEAGLVDDSGR
jgi:DNA-binding NarL/FixJ family response regulator